MHAGTWASDTTSSRERYGACMSNRMLLLLLRPTIQMLAAAAAAAVPSIALLLLNGLSRASCTCPASHSLTSTGSSVSSPLIFIIIRPFPPSPRLPVSVNHGDEITPYIPQIAQRSGPRCCSGATISASALSQFASRVRFLQMLLLCTALLLLGLPRQVPRQRHEDWQVPGALATLLPLQSPHP